jgi:hypothetical protein
MLVMTELSTTSPTLTAPFSKQLPLVGFVQGLLLWLLLDWIPKHYAIHLPVLWTILIFLVFIRPMLWYWTAQADMSLNRRWWGATLIALWVTLLPVDFSTLFMASKQSMDAQPMRYWFHSDASLLPTAILGIVATHLLIGWRVKSSPIATNSIAV